MAFLTTNEMKTHIYGGVQTLISQGDNSLLQTAIDEAIEEAKGYLSRYNLQSVFETGSQDKILKLHVKNIAKWNFLGLGNANIDWDDVQSRYNRAIKWLSDVQAGNIVPVGWTPATPEEQATFFHVSSNRKRGNHY